MSVTRRELIAAVAAATVTSTIRAEEAALNPEAEARIAWILGRYGDRFSDEQKSDIRRNIRNMQSGFDAMRAYPLDNAVEPATLFRIHRGPARERSPKS